MSTWGVYLQDKDVAGTSLIVTSIGITFVLLFMRSFLLHGLSNPLSPTAAKKKVQTEFSANHPTAADAILDVIRSRRSVYPKDFNGKVISKHVITQILEAGNWAPTHKVTEPWRFVVIAGDAKNELADLTEGLCRSLLAEDKREKVLQKLQGKRGKTFPVISHFIALCMKRYPKENTANPEWEEMCAVAAAAQNMMLAATALGVSGYWTSWQEVAREAPEMKAYLGIGPEDKCLGFLVLGYSDRAGAYRGSRRPVNEKVIWKA